MGSGGVEGLCGEWLVVGWGSSRCVDGFEGCGCSRDSGHPSGVLVCRGVCFVTVWSWVAGSCSGRDSLSAPGFCVASAGTVLCRSCILFGCVPWWVAWFRCAFRGFSASFGGARDRYCTRAPRSRRGSGRSRPSSRSARTTYSTTNGRGRRSRYARIAFRGVRVKGVAPEGGRAGLAVGGVTVVKGWAREVVVVVGEVSVCAALAWGGFVGRYAVRSVQSRL